MVQVGVDLWAGGDIDRTRRGQGAEAGRVGVAQQFPDIFVAAELARIEAAVHQVVAAAVVEEVDQVGAERRILKHHVAGFAHQTMPEQQAIFLIGQFTRQGAGAWNNLKGGLE